MVRHKARILIAGGLFLIGSASLSSGQDSETTIPSENSVLTLGKAATVLPDASGVALPVPITLSSPKLSESAPSNANGISSAAATPSQSQANEQGNTQNQVPPNNSQAPSLEDLGLSASQSRGDPQLQ